MYILVDVDPNGNTIYARCWQPMIPPEHVVRPDHLCFVVAAADILFNHTTPNK